MNKASIPTRFHNPPLLTEGQLLWRVTVTSYGRTNNPPKEESVFVQHIGRKYFTVRPVGQEQEWADSTHFIEDWRKKTDYVAECSLFPSQQDYQDTLLKLSLYQQIKEMLTFNCPPELTLPEVQHLHRFLTGALDPNKKLPGSENTT